jgi:S1-C subfamily serine protease
MAENPVSPKKNNTTLWLVLVGLIGLVLGCCVGAVAGGAAGYALGQGHGSAFRALQVPTPEGLRPQGQVAALVTAVVADSPADKAGIRTGDIIVAVNRQALSSTRDLTKAVSGLKPGDKVTLSVERGMMSRDIAFTVGEKTGAAGQPYLGINYYMTSSRPGSDTGVAQ